ncbi:zincin-like metallopeptidase toxin domain-containing protein [Apibacter muscae]|uniref:zincin-like metallopeptidase toxin domain-containing protein n=1 Tax=Apibacter muscae TaxID=2509004 RepID=UPI001C87D9DD|nr:zincin-like metallopeptidase toxin domain-containing protein [Apibacter muscae]
MKQDAKYNEKGERIFTVREFKKFKKEMADLCIKVEFDNNGKVLKGDNVGAF